jgi:hypothetical protein
MQKFFVILSFALLAGLSVAAQNPAIEPVLRSELAFARLADQAGIRTAFRTWLTEEARVFSPRLTRAKAAYAPEPGDPGQLAWYPEAMGISAAGDLAWSFGPWTYAAKKGAPILAHGHFLSLWRLQADHQWKVVADIGVSHAAPPQPIEPFAPQDLPPSLGKALPKTTDALPALRQKEAQLWLGRASLGGLALVPELAKGARVLRPEAPPAQAGAELQKLLRADPPGDPGETPLLEVAASGDLGWSCGETGPAGGRPGSSFLRIWTLESGVWKVLFDVNLPHPAAKS